MPNTLESTIAWFNTAKPVPTGQDAKAQLAYHLEEIGEMLLEMDSEDWDIKQILFDAQQSIDTLSNMLKFENSSLVIRDPVKFLDAMGDQYVTGIGVCEFMKFKTKEAYDEINRSNWSKFVDGKPILNEYGKIMKPETFSEPDLTKFI